jgi:chaperonin GroES
MNNAVVDRKAENLIDSPLKPLGKRVVVLPDPPMTVTKGGIHLPDRAQKQTSRGTVLAVGELVNFDEHGEPNKLCPLERGDRVVYGDWSGNTVEVDRVEVRVLEDKDILGTL